MLFPLLFGIFTAATAVQLFAWWAGAGRLACYRPPETSSGSKTVVPLSVIICARNEAANLRRHLPAILEQVYPDFEVLVIDDDSGDETEALLQGFEKKYPQLRRLRVSPKAGPGKKAALARGIDAARHEWLVFTDADCRPATPHWLAGLAAKMPPEHPGTEIVLGYAPLQATPTLLNRWARFETVHTALLYFSFALAGKPYMGVGRNLAWHRQVFDRTGGFAAHAALPSGDDDLIVNAAANARNTTICLDPEAFVYSESEKTWRAWLRQKRRQLGAGKYYRPEHQFALGLLAVSQTLHYFLLMVLVFSPFGMVSVIFYALRMISATMLSWKILGRFRERHLLIWFPLLDVLLAAYQTTYIPLVLIRSNHLISWK